MSSNQFKFLTMLKRG